MIAELNKAYTTLNKKLFNGELPKPKFEVDISSKTVFRYRGEQRDEIIIGTGFVTIEKDEILDALLHVMIHVFNYRRGIEDCTTNQYHKLEFTEVALKVGLTVMKSPSRGWGLTTSKKKHWEDKEDVRHPHSVNVSRRHDAYRRVKFDADRLTAFQESIQQKIDSTGKKHFLLKYICRCPPPHNSIRSGRRPTGSNRLNIKCNKCGSKFKVEHN